MNPHRLDNFTEMLPEGVKLEMVYIPAGSFMMGSNEDESEQPIHKVTFKQGFYMGKYPITQAQYQAIMGKNPSRFKGNNNPVESVSWYMAEEFCQKLSQKTGRKYQLPSEAQWEYACRAKTTTTFYFGEILNDQLANYDATDTSYHNAKTGRNRERTTPVGTFPPNQFGLYDMHGNVYEWCADTWHYDYNNAPTDGKAWVDNSININRLLVRGGCWCYDQYFCRSAFRYFYGGDLTNDVIGFRIVSLA